MYVGRAMTAVSVAGMAESVDEDDPNKEKEAELMLEYIEKFNQLLDDGHYEQAAVHAANSPKGILRTAQAMQMFKGSLHSAYTYAASSLPLCVLGVSSCTLIYIPIKTSEGHITK